MISFFLLATFTVHSGAAALDDPCVNLLSEKLTELVISFKPPAAQFTTVEIDGRNFAEITLPGEGRIGREGLPDLPAITRILIVPQNGNVKIEILHDNTVEIDAESPPHPFKNDNQDLSHFASSLVPNGLYPPETAVVGASQSFRGTRLVPVTFYPYQYDAANRQFIHHEDVEVAVRIETAEGDENKSTPDLFPRTMTRDTYRFLNALTLNGPHRDDNGARLPRGGYLIATRLNENQVDEHVNRLADWKRACGHHVEIVYGEDNGNTLRNNQISEGYEEWDPPLEFACIIGPFAERQGITDILYGCLDGNNDHVPEVAVTRLGAISATQADVVISRALSYQQYPWLEEMEWFDRAGAMANNVGRSHTPAVDHTITWIAEAERRAGFPEVEWYSADGGRGSPSQWLGDGLSVLFERGFSRGIGFGNYQFHPVWISVGGGHVPGMVDQVWNYGSPNNPVGPSVLTGTGHNPSTLPCNVLCGGMARGLIIERLPLGWARAFAMIMLDYANVGGFGQFAEEYRVLGEPGQRVWIGRPTEMEVQHDDEISPGQNQYDVVATDAEQEVSIPNALVTLTQPGELIVSGYTDEHGRCSLLIDHELDEDVILTVTGEGLLPFQSEIEIEQSRIYINASILEIDDEDGGNGDETLNPGETVNILITAENLSDDENVEGVTGILSVASTWLTIEDIELNFGDIDPEEEVRADEPVEISLDSSAPEGAELGLAITLRSGDNEWISFLQIDIVGANLDLDEIVDGNVLEPEMCELDIVVENVGGIRSQAMNADLVSNSQWIQMIRSDGVYLAIDPDESSGLEGDPFLINPSPIAPPGLTVPMMVLLRSDENDVPDTVYFEIQIGRPHQNGPTGPDEYGYICFDDSDDGWEQAPVFDWIEIDPDNGDRDFNGEPLPGNRNRDDLTWEVELPFEFQFYGEVFDRITISENGFIAMGEGLDDLKQYENFPLDRVMNGSFGMVAPYWDDLNITDDDADIFTYFDEDEHIFIVQWHEIPINNNNNRLDFQVVFYDMEFFPVVSGDGKILFQYLEVPNPVRGNSPAYFSTGICSPNGYTGINYVSGNDYPDASSPIEDRRALMFTTSPAAPRGVIYGNVHDVDTDRPMEDVVILTSYGQVAFTDENGDWIIPDAWALPFSITADKQGWNDSTLTDFELSEDDTIEINFGLLHPEFVPSVWELSTTLDPDLETEMGFTLVNAGNGPLDWKVERRLLGDANAPPWENRRSFNVGQEVDDDHLEGVVFVDEHFFVVGGNDRNPIIYKFDREGALVDTFPQFDMDDRRGMRDLAWDGELIWGSVYGTIYGFNTEGELDTSFQAPFRPITAIAYDTDRELLWITSTTTDIFAITREGVVIDSLQIDRRNLRMYGLAYWEDDPDGFNLYVFHRDRETSRQIVHKFNPLNGDSMFVACLETELDAGLGGAYITNKYDIYSWVFVTLTSAGRQVGGDCVNLWQIEARRDWFQLDIIREDRRFEADSGRIECGESFDYVLTLNSAELPDTLFEGELLFYHNADSGRGHISVLMDVIGPMPPFPFSLASPADGDTLDTTAVALEWNPSIDPNTDDVVSYRAWISLDQDTVDFALDDTTMNVDLLQLFGFNIDEPAVFNWWVTAYSDPDSVPCESPFSFRYIPPSFLNDPLAGMPVEFGFQSTYPNPFNARVAITFGADKAERTLLRVFDITGRKVTVLYNGIPTIGYHRITWNAVDLPAGIYLLRFESAGRIRIAKTALIK